MTRLIFHSLLVGAAIVATHARARTAEHPLDAHFKTIKKNGLVSVDVVRITDGTSLYSLSPEQQLSPASVTKLVTAAAVLTKFSSGHTFSTRFYHTGQRQGKRVIGDLVVVGDGDPFVVSEQLWQVASDLRHLGITEFSGDIVLDNSLFGDRARDASRAGGQKASSHAYDAPVSAFAVNFNTLAVAIAPSAEGSVPSYVELDPLPIRGLSLENHVRTVDKGSGGIRVSRVGAGSSMKLVVNGVISSHSDLVKFYRSVEDHVHASGELLRAFLGASGITVRGQVREGKLPQNANHLLTLSSYPMLKIIEGLNKFSNNFIADMLVKRLGAAFPPSGKPNAPGSGTMANGVRVLNDFLQNDVGLNSTFTILNGSGLAPENRLSAKQLVAVLKYVAKRFEIYPEFLASLPGSGMDGTLENRFGHDDSLRGLIRAKTGTLSQPISVASLAGYFQHPEHGTVAFAIIENGKANAEQPGLGDMRAHMDSFLKDLIQKL